MPRYDQNYDFGLRGSRETTGFRPRGPFRPRGYDYDLGPDDRRPPLPNRVTARYNLDYVVGKRGDRYPRNYNPFGGDREDRVGDLRYYRRPYNTIGGTRTFRGSSRPMGYGYDYVGYDREFRR